MVTVEVAKPHYAAPASSYSSSSSSFSDQSQNNRKPLAPATLYYPGYTLWQNAAFISRRLLPVSNGLTKIGADFYVEQKKITHIYKCNISKEKHCFHERT